MTDASEDFSPNLSLPFLLPAQAQKHVTVNEALTIVDAVVMASVISRSTDAPPPSPQNGDAYLLSENASGDWQAHTGELAVWTDTAWTFYVPRAGWRIWDRQEGALLVYDGDAWRALTAAGDELSSPQIGVNTVADPLNRLAVKSDAVLLSHDDVTPGSGDARLTINKKDAAGTASILFQSDWTGRAEIGLSGDDALALRTSEDGTIFSTALSLHSEDSSIVVPNGIRIGGNDDANHLPTFERGTWTPSLGGTRTGDFAGMTDLTVERAQYMRIGDVVFLDLVCALSGTAAKTFDQASTLQITGLPFMPISAVAAIDDGGVHGFAYQSVGNALNSALSGGVSRNQGGSIYLFVVIAATGNAENTSTLYIKATYTTDDAA